MRHNTRQAVPGPVQAVARSRPNPFRTALWVVLCAGIVTPLGCNDADTIREYDVAKRPQHAPPVGLAGETGQAEANSRMVAAIVPQGGQSWFFKVTGPAEPLEAHVDAFRDLVRSVRFAEGNESSPTWQLPDGWQQDPASGMRYATLRFGSEEAPFKLSVIPLPTAGDPAAYTLSNVNRWRGQLALAPLDADQMAAQCESIDLAGGAATLVNLVGSLRQDPMAHSGLVGGGVVGGGLATPTTDRPAAGPRNGAAPALTYQVPEGWTAGRSGGMRKAAFTVTDGPKSAEITAIDLPASAGDLLPNVNRWRGQIQLGEITQEELDRDATPIKVAGRTGQSFDMVAPEDATPREAIVGVVVEHAGKAWFFKMKGDADLVRTEKERFESFVRSVRFTSP